MHVRYLTEHKAITVDSKERKCGMKFLLVREDGSREVRTYDYQEMIANALNPITFRIKGIRYSGLFETFPDDATGLPVVSSFSAKSKG